MLAAGSQGWGRGQPLGQGEEQAAGRRAGHWPQGPFQDWLLPPFISPSPNWRAGGKPKSEQLQGGGSLPAFFAVCLNSNYSESSTYDLELGSVVMLVVKWVTL